MSATIGEDLHAVTPRSLLGPPRGAEGDVG